MASWKRYGFGGQGQSPSLHPLSCQPLVMWEGDRELSRWASLREQVAQREWNESQPETRSPPAWAVMDYGLSEFWPCSRVAPSSVLWSLFEEASLSAYCPDLGWRFKEEPPQWGHECNPWLKSAGFLAQLFLHLQVSPFRADRQGRALAYQLSVLNLCFQNWPRVSQVLDICHLLNVPVHLVW